MSGSELPPSTISELAPMLRRRELSPVEITAGLLRRIEECDRTLGAYLTVVGELALAQAERAEAEIRAGHYRGPLHGVPITHKDVFQTAGVRTTAHSRALADWYPDEDAAVVTRLADAGAVMLGKSNCHELACGAMGAFPVARNPWDPARAAGGTSSGGATAVAGQLAMAATGSDTGGSVRVPAAFTGIVGLKPTYGRVSCFGLLPISRTFDHVGTLTSCVADAATMLQALAGPDSRDRTSARSPIPDFAREIGRDLQGLRVGVPSDAFFHDLHPDVARAVEASQEVLRAAGAEVIAVELSAAELHSPVHAILWLAEAAVVLAAFLDAEPRSIGDVVFDRVRVGRLFSAEDYLVAMQARRRMIADLDELFGRIDALALPTTPSPAYRIDGPMAARSDVGRFNRLANLSGQPALSLPCGFAAGSLPVGLQLVGRPWQEPLLLGIAHAFEQATAWHRERPALGASRPAEVAEAETAHLAGAASAPAGSAPAPPAPASPSTLDWLSRRARARQMALSDEELEGMAQRLEPLKRTLDLLHSSPQRWAGDLPTRFEP